MDSEAQRNADSSPRAFNDEALSLVRAGSYDLARVTTLLDSADALMTAIGMPGWLRKVGEPRERVRLERCQVAR
jgi:hypothetical protein